MFDLPTESDIVLELSDQLFIEIGELFLQMSHNGSIFCEEGALQGGLSLHHFVPHEPVIASSIVNAVREVKK